MMKLLSIVLATAAFTVDAGKIRSNNKDLDDKNVEAEEVAFWTRSLQSSLEPTPRPSL